MFYSSTFSLGIRGTQLKTQPGMMAFQLRQLVKQLEIKIILGGTGKREPELESLPFFATYLFCKLSKSPLCT